MSIRRIAMFVVPVFGIATLGIVALGAGAAGAGHRFPFHPPISPEDHRAMAEQRLAFALEAVDAAEEQAAEIDAILAEAWAQGETFRAEHEAKHEEVKDLLSAETLDREALEAMRVEGVDRFDEVSQVFVQVLADIGDVLTVEQRQELISLAESRRMK